MEESLPPLQQTRCLWPYGLCMRQQLPRQRVVLQPGHQQQCLRLARVNGIEQRIGCIGGMPCPHDRQGRNGLLILQSGGSVWFLQIGLHALRPAHAVRGRLRGRNGRQLQSSLAHPVGQPGSLLRQSRLLQQALCSKPIAAGVECQVVVARGKRPQALRPTPAGFELRHQAGGELLCPLPLRHGHELRKRHVQHLHGIAASAAECDR